MRAPARARLFLASAVAALGACGGATGPGDGAGPAVAIRAVSGSQQTGQVASLLPSPFVVLVTDARARPVAGVSVTWAVVGGNGVITPSSTITGNDGTAQAVLSIGITAGVNQVNAAVSGVSSGAVFQATGTPGPLAKIVASLHAVTLCSTAQAGHVTASTTDLYGNAVPATVTWQSRNPAVVTVDASGNVQLLSTAAGAYVVATSGTASPDSVYVSAAQPVTLAVGGVNENLPSATFCVQSTEAGSEFALVAYNNLPTPGLSTTVQVVGSALAAVGSGASVVPAGAALAVQPVPAVKINTAFEIALRERERREIPPYVAAARAAVRTMEQQRASARTASVPGRSTAVGVQAISDAVQVGNLVQLNTGFSNGCGTPAIATARVAAISNSATVVADTANPAGGFTDADYLSFAMAMDTLVNPVDTTAFGAPYPLGGNKRTVIFFTRAVNQLTTDVSQGIVLGFYYERDLLPVSACAGSNFANMFYLLVPDPSGTINGGNTITRNKANVAQYIVSTIGHEYQHLINASRRMYVLNVPASDVNEETWLNEGLSHTAEDLIFYRAAGLTPRQNIGVATLALPQPAAAFSLYEHADFSRYQTYLSDPETHAPVGVSGDDNLYLRGAIQSFLRYLCDRLQTTDGNFWYRLVNDSTTGIDNLQHVIGADPSPYFREWATSVFTDDYVPGVSAVFTQPSWNWRAVMPVESTGGFDLLTHPLSSAVPVSVNITARGVSYFQFAVPAGQSSLISVTSAGGAPPSTIQLTLVRTK
jgi:hypothetical protein